MQRKKTVSLFCLTFFLLLLFSCADKEPSKQENTEEVSVNDSIYHDKGLGWTIEIPEGWEVIPMDQVQERSDAGKKAVEDQTGVESESSKLRYLVSFRKDQFNYFTSTSEPFEEKEEGEYLSNTTEIRKVIYNSIANQGIQIDTASGQDTIQGLEFNVFTVTITMSDSEQQLRQVIYTRLHKGFDFSVAINYTNEADKEVLMKAWKDSKFEK